MIKLGFASGNEQLYDLVARSNAAVVADYGPSYTVQSDAADADINNIVERFGLTGRLPTGLRMPEYGDFDLPAGDYYSALLAVKEADALFMQLPAELRAQFQNDPGQFVAFATDPANVDELRSMGLLDTPPVQFVEAPAPTAPIDTPPAT